MTNTFIRRSLAWIIDYGIIASYATGLFLVTRLLISITHWEPINDPFNGQVVGFLTLTLPVIIYSYLTEKGIWCGTVGKKLLKLVVLTDHNNRARNILLRNILKYLPWELAHTGVHWVVYYTSNNMEVPTWTWLLLILPQLIVIIYFASILLSKGETSIYDKFSNTRIAIRVNK